MAIFKANVNDQYVVIPNETAQDSSLTFEARGLLALMLSLPCDWEIYKEWLLGQSPNCKRDKLARLLGELATAGYIRKSQKRNSCGKFISNDYLVYPTTVDGLSVDGFTVDGKTPTTKETSFTKETPHKDSAKRTVCPYEDIKNIYCEELPMLTGCRKMDAKTKKQILEIWKSEEQHQSLDFWRMYFQSIKRLTNRMPNWAGEVDGTKHGTLELLTRDKIFARSVNELIDQGIWK